MKRRTRETARGSDFPGKGKEDQDRLYGAGRWVLKDLHGLSSWYFEGGLHSEEPAEDNDKKTKASSSLVRHRKRQVRKG